MANLDEALIAHRAAVNELIAAGEACGDGWSAPRSPGKWSPSQTLEHIARALEESAHVAMDAPSKFPKFPGFVRPIARKLLFDRVLRMGAFPRGRTTSAFNPTDGSRTPSEARARMDDVLSKFDDACRICARGGGMMTSSMFGTVGIVDYVRFQELHARHHLKQMPWGVASR